MAYRILLELGWSPDNALDTIRTVRPIAEIMGFACGHTNLTRTVELTNQALGFINDIAQNQKPNVGWEGDSPSLAAEFVRRALEGRSVEDLVLTRQYVDPDGNTGPMDPQPVIDQATAISGTAGTSFEITPDPLYGDSEGEGCHFVGDFHIECGVFVHTGSQVEALITVTMTRFDGFFGVDGMDYLLGP